MISTTRTVLLTVAMVATCVSLIHVTEWAKNRPTHKIGGSDIKEASHKLLKGLNKPCNTVDAVYIDKVDGTPSVDCDRHKIRYVIKERDGYWQPVKVIKNPERIITE